MAKKKKKIKITIDENGWEVKQNGYKVHEILGILELIKTECIQTHLDDEPHFPNFLKPSAS